jgi:adenine phosphoribosyltransferase
MFVLHVSQEVPCFTVLDSNTISADMCKDPPEGTPRVVAASEVESQAAALPSRYNM